MLDVVHKRLFAISSKLIRSKNLLVQRIARANDGVVTRFEVLDIFSVFCHMMRDVETFELGCATDLPQS